MYIIMQVVFFFLDIIYLFFKLLPTQHKVVFLSRQANSPSADIELVAARLKKEDPSIKTVVLAKKIEGGIVNKIKYCFHMLVQMYHISTSEVAVLDSYCILISCLHHKKKLKVVQMWHGLGCFKKFAYSIIDKGEGSSLKLAKAMHMHENYDYVLTSSEFSKDAFAEAFNVDKSIIRIAPLPKVDLLRDKAHMAELAIKIKDTYPKLKEKKNILYVPTFRKDESEQIVKINELIDAVNYDEYNLVLSLHPLTKATFSDERIVVNKDFYSFEMAAIADYVISDYSATTYEMALMDKKLFYYTFDADKYDDDRGFYTSLQDFPGPKCSDAKQLLNLIDTDDYDLVAVKQFADKYVDPLVTDCCKNIVDIILEK